MLTPSLRRILLAGALCTLAACGGDSITSTPGPTLGPPPPPPPPPPSGQAPFGVTDDAEFATVGDAVSLRWIASRKAYELTLPNETADVLEFGGNDNRGEIHYGRGLAIAVRTDLDYSHTGYASVFENGWGSEVGNIAFGIPTRDGDVPVTGTASYEAEAHGGDGRVGGATGYQPHNFFVRGTAKLTFDFGAGLLSGHFDPVLRDLYGNSDDVPLGRYVFVNTLYGSGKPSFSGKLQHNDFADLGSFEGRFTGPQAAELLSQWQMPFLDPRTNEQSTLRGVWIGRKRN